MKASILRLALPAIFVSCGLCGAQTVSFEDAVLRITGAGCMEELDESVVERYRILHDHPLDLNSAPRSRLLSSGLLSPWQTAMLLDLRNRTGDILSYAELSLLEGFPSDFTEALRLFTVLRTSAPAAHTEYRRTSHDFLLKASARSALPGDGIQTCYGLKYSMTLGERAELHWASRTTYDSPGFTAGKFSVAYNGRSLPVKLLLGEYNARFGQGLAAWSGFSLSGFSSVSSFRRNGTGLSATSSFSGGLHGAAAEVDVGKWALSAAYSHKGLLGLANVTRYGRTCTAGASAMFSKSGGAVASADFRAGFPGLSFFGEAAMDFRHHTPAALFGALWIPSYGYRLAVLARWYPAAFSSPLSGAVRSSTKVSDERGVSAGLQFPWLSATFDLSDHPSKEGMQCKSVLVLSKEFRYGADSSGLSVKPSLRVAARYRPDETLPLRTDLRGDLALSWGAARLNARYNALWYRDMAWLWYVEPGVVLPSSGGRPTLNLWCRLTLFKVDDWDDRIYSYERDAPGSFNVPAYYGREYSASLYSAVRSASGRHRLCMRLSLVDYPWMEKEKPGRAEARVQYQLCL